MDNGELFHYPSVSDSNEGLSDLFSKQ